jgi:hypothetical protein
VTPLDLDAIYKLLPAVYRIRDADLALRSGVTLDPADAEQLASLLLNLTSLTPSQQQTLALLQDKQQRGPLKSLIAILAEQIEVLQESLYQSYDDLFIETCQEWVVPYIGDLVGSEGLADFPGTPYSLRAAVANTIRNRRRKGTVYGLEQLSHDVTGWPANVVEYFQILATTQFMNHIRPQNLSMADVRNADWGLPETPFDTKARTVDVRSIAAGRGKFNIPNIGIYLWRLLAEPLENSPAFQVDARRYKFDAIGRDTQLFTLPPGTPVTNRRVTPLDVPMPISRRMLYAQFYSYYGRNLSVTIDESYAGSPPVRLRACNLSDVTDSHGHVIGWAHAPKDDIAIDPQLGRIVFPSNMPPPSAVHVKYCYGFSAEMGGGPYSRPLDDTADVLIRVPSQYPTIQAAINQAAFEFSGGASSAIIEIDNNEYYVETPDVALPAGASLAIQAADNKRPVLVLSGDFHVSGDAESSFALNGLFVAGGAISAPAKFGALPNLLTSLTISHCTLAPMATPAIDAAPGQMMGPRVLSEAQDLNIEIDHSITGPLRISAENTVTLSDSIVDAGAPFEIAYADPTCTGFGAPLTITNCTVIGKVATRQMTLASDTIFFAEVLEGDLWTIPVHIERLQQGCTRFSYVPPGSQVPRAYRCYPAPNDATPSVPAFTSLRFGDPGYCQLAAQSPTAILQGADNQSEMGAFNSLYQPQRVANLRTMLVDYLRFGLEAGLFYAT